MKQFCKNCGGRLMYDPEFIPYPMHASNDDTILCGRPELKVQNTIQGVGQ